MLNIKCLNTPKQHSDLRGPAVIVSGLRVCFVDIVSFLFFRCSHFVPSTACMDSEVASIVSDLVDTF